MTAAELAGRVGLKRKGSEFAGPCPLCGGDDRFHVSDGKNGVLLAGCRGCCASFRDLMAACGGGSDGPAPLAEYVCRGPDGERVHLRRLDRSGKKTYPWKGEGPLPRRLLYIAGDVTDEGPIIVTEGEKAADAAHEKTGFAAVGTVTGCKGQPDQDVWRWLPVDGRELVCWPDRDDDAAKGQRHMNRVARDLIDLGADVHMVNPDSIGLTGDGDDAAEWSGEGGLDAIMAATSPILGKPNGPAGGRSSAVRPAILPAILPEAGPGLSEAPIWRAWAEVEAADMVPAAVIPWLAWRGEMSLLVATEKDGKTTLLTQAVFAAITGGYFLGQPTDLRGERIAYMTEMGAGRTKRWISERGVEAADVDFLRPCGYDELESYIRERKPALLVTDTLIAFGTSNRADENNANDMRRLANMLRATGTTSITSHHAMKHDASRYRGSGDVAAAPDMVITMTLVDGGKPTDRKLSYRGRWPMGDDDELLIEFDRPTRTYRAGVELDDEGRLLHVVSINDGCTRYKAIEVAGLKVGGRSYAAINRLIADGRITLDSDKGLHAGGAS